MPLPKISEARNLSDEELAQAIIDVKSNYFSYGCKATRYRQAAPV